VLGVGQEGNHSLGEGVADVGRELDGVGKDALVRRNTGGQSEVEFRGRGDVKAAAAGGDALEDPRVRTAFDGVVDLHVFFSFEKGEEVRLDLSQVVHEHRARNSLKCLDQLWARWTQRTRPGAQLGQACGDVRGGVRPAGGRTFSSPVTCAS